MMFDVGIRLGYNAEGKAINRYYRIHDTLLSESVRRIQDTGQYVFSIIPLFRKKEDSNLRYAIANGIVVPVSPVYLGEPHLSQIKDTEEVEEHGG